MKIEKLCLNLIVEKSKLTADVSFLSKQVEIYKALYLGELNKNIEKDIKNETISTQSFK